MVMASSAVLALILKCRTKATSRRVKHPDKIAIIFFKLVNPLLYMRSQDIFCYIESISGVSFFRTGSTKLVKRSANKKIVCCYQGDTYSFNQSDRLIVNHDRVIF